MIAASSQFFNFSATSCIAVLMKMVLLQSATQMNLSCWAWSAYWLASNNCHLWGSSSRCDSNNAYSEFLRSKFLISILYSVRYNLLWSDFSPRIACWALRWGFSRRSHPSEENCLKVWREWLPMLFRRLFLDIDYATLITNLFFLSLSLSSNRCPDACSLRFLFEEQNHHDKRAKQRRSGSSMSIVSLTTEVILSNSLGS